VADLGQRPLGDLAGALVSCSQHVAQIPALAHELGAGAATVRVSHRGQAKNRRNSLLRCRCLGS
jgi:hypothetical protein